MITWENYEEYMMMHADGELNPTETQALMAFVSEHPELKKELTAYGMTRLIPDSEVVFEQKDQLLRKEENRRVIAFPMWQRYSIAAGVAAIVFISLFKPGNGGNKSAVAVRTDTDRAPIVMPIDHTPITQQNVSATQNATAATPDAAKNNDVATVAPVKGVSVKPAATAKTMLAQRREHTADAPIAQAAHTDLINKMHPTGIKEIPNDGIAVAMPVETEVPALPEQRGADEQNGSFFDKLPIDDIKKQSMQQMATALTYGVDRINDVKQEINEASITVKVHKRKLIVSF